MRRSLKHLNHIFFVIFHSIPFQVIRSVNVSQNFQIKFGTISRKWLSVNALTYSRLDIICTRLQLQ